MDGQHTWKRTEEVEIDLADLLRGLCRQWKWIAVCALVFALLLGGYGWLKVRNSSDITESDTEEVSELTAIEEQAVADAVRLEQESRGLKAYLDNSVLMQLDPYHRCRYIMLYCIHNAKRQELPVITESYLSFVSNGGAADALLESGSGQKLEKSCLAELIAAYQKTYSSPYQIVADEQADSSQMTESLFYVEVTGMNAEAAEKMAVSIQGILKKYSVEIKKSAGSHRLTLISSMKSVTADSGLQSLQHDKKALLSSNRTSLKAMTDAFSKEQMIVFKETAGIEDEDGPDKNVPGESVFDETSSSQSPGSVLKYIFLGLIGGMFVYCCIYTCQYIFHDTVRSTEEMRRLYAFPVYGGISIPAKNRNNHNGVPEAYMDTYGRTEAQTLNRVRLACKKQEITKLCAAADFALGAAERECLDRMSVQLERWGIHMEVLENASADTAIWDEMAEAGCVLMVCRIGSTTHRMIDDAMDFYLENGITVAGAVAFLQNT